MNYNFFLKAMFILTSMTSLFTDSLIFMWTMMEINMLFLYFIMWTNFMESQKHILVKFFIIQSYSSYILMFSILLKYNFVILSFDNLTIFILWLKMGFIPLHFWLISLIQFFPFNIFFYFMIISKLIPMIMIYHSIVDYKLIFFFIIINSFSIVYYGSNCSNWKIMLYLSSINVSPLFLLTSNYYNFIWLNLMYLILNFFLYNLMKMLIKSNQNSMDITMNFLKLSPKLTCFVILSISGFPPLVMFWMKVLIFQEIQNLSIIIMFMLNVITSIYMYASFLLNFLLSITPQNFNLKYTNLLSFFNYKQLNFLIIFNLFLANFTIF